ncbi:MAG: hypothetical protein U1F68_07365 [Gammaproteobacteria bacterium]
MPSQYGARVFTVRIDTSMGRLDQQIEALTAMDAYCRALACVPTDARLRSLAVRPSDLAADERIAA